MKKRLQPGDKGYQWYKDNHCIKGKICSSFNDQVTSSKRRGHPPPTYTVWKLIERYEHDKLFIKLFNAWEASNWNRWLAPSFDRIDNSKGYSFDNIKLMTWKENYDNARRDQRLGKLGSSSKHKAVRQFTKEGKFIAEYISMKEAERRTGISNNNIGSCCKGNLKSAGGYKWEYTN